MDVKKICVIVIIIGLCLGIVWIVFSNISNKEVKEGVNFNTTFQETFNSLTEEEKDQLRELKNETNTNHVSEGITGKQYNELPETIKDVINPPSLREGIENLLYGEK